MSLVPNVLNLIPRVSLVPSRRTVKLALRDPLSSEQGTVVEPRDAQSHQGDGYGD